MLGYKVPKPDQVMLISGRKSTETEPFRISRQGKWVVPGFRVARYLSLSQQKAEIEEPCTTVQGIDGIFKAVVAFHIANDDKSIYAAGLRFLDDQGVDRKTGIAAMVGQTGGIFAGHLRSIVGAMTLEEIMQQRQKLATEVLDASKVEVGRMGLEIDSFLLTSIEGDQVKKYMAALSAPHSAKIQQQAAVAQAEAQRAAAEAQQSSARQQAEYERDTRLKQAEYKAVTDKADAEAAQAGPLASALAEQAVIDTQRETAQRNAALVEQQLVAQVQRPAEAEARKMRIIAAGAADQAEEQGREMRVTAEAQAGQTKVLAAANAESRKLAAAAEAEGVRVNGLAEADAVRARGLADAEAERAKADAAAANDRVQVELARINMMPEVARALASAWQGSDTVVFNGADGLTQLVTAAAQQARALIDMFTKPETDGQRDGEALSVSQELAQLEAERGLA